VERLYMIKSWVRETEEVEFGIEADFGSFGSFMFFKKGINART
jgi:hypothetical protein